MKRKKESKQSFLQKHYSQSWAYIKESKIYILAIVLILLMSSVVASVYQPTFLVELIKKFLKTVLGDIQNLNLFEMIIYILNNNLKSSFYAMILGVFFGIFPVFTAISNGYVIGFVAEKSVQAEGIFVLWRLFPHGIFEFPAVILALALGISLGTYIFSAKEKSKASWSFIVSILCMLFLSSAVFSVIGSIFQVSSGAGSLSDPSANLISNPAIEPLLLVSTLVIFILSTLIGMAILSKDDRKIVSKEFLRRLENSLRVFLFVILPLLIIAAIIEGGLIIFLR